MNSLEELQDELRSTQSQLDRVSADLAKFLELKNSLEASNVGLRSSSDSLTKLALTLEEIAGGLKATSLTVQRVSQFFGDDKLVEVKSGQEAIEHQLQEMNGKINSLSSEIDGLLSKVSSTAVNAAEELESRFRSSSAREWAMLVLLVALLGVFVFGFYLEHGVDNWLSAASLQEDPEAGVELGGPLQREVNATIDYSEAARTLRPAAEAGDPNAQNNLGALYLMGRGVPKDLEEASKWFRFSADQGVAEAQYNLGSMYLTGEGIEPSDTEAIRWWRLAAEQGYPDAAYNLGVAYSDGFGVSQNDSTAAEWFLIAAEQGHIDAQLALGGSYLSGTGVTHDNIQALKWLILAAQGSEGKSDEVKTMALDRGASARAQMSDAEIETAETLSANWRPK
jgi:TPR repeat protein